MLPEANSVSHRVLFFNTLAFTICFAAWMLNGVLVTFLADNKIFDWNTVEVGWLLGIPVLSGSLFRLPAGMLTDRYGGKWVFGLLLLLCAVPMFFLSYADNFVSFALLSFGFGLAGTGFAVGIANSSVWYPKKLQGTALGIFGIGNAGAALTTLVAPAMLNYFTANSPDGWRNLPKCYSAMLAIMGIVFLLFTENKKPAAHKTMGQMLSPLKNMRVWRFGLYYFLVFGCFVAFSQWLVPYFLNVYAVSLVTAGILASLFSFPSGVIRAAGGWLSDLFGARKVMYWVLGSSVIISLMLTIPRMEIFSPGKGIMAAATGTVTYVSDSLIKVDNTVYKLNKEKSQPVNTDRILIFPAKGNWHEPVVKTGDRVSRKQLLAKGTTYIYFDASFWIFVTLVTLIGISWGIGKAAVYKYIPDYFSEEVGVVGGLVGVIGGLGGFFCPILFGYALEWTGLWTSSWMLMFLLSLACLGWMHYIVRKKGE